MPNAALEVEIINKVTNMGAFAEEKAALSSLAGGGFGPGGPASTAAGDAAILQKLEQAYGASATPKTGGLAPFFNPSFGGALSNQETALAKAQLSELESVTKKTSGAFAEYETKLKNAVIVSGEAGAVTDGLARKMSALGSLGLTPMTAGLIGATIGIAGLVEAGKSMIDNAEKNETAQRSLTQAFASQGKDLSLYQDGIDIFINKNARYISNQFQVKDAFASGTRAGFDFQTTVRLVNDALDLSVAKHIDLGTAMDDLIKLKTGRASQEFAALGIQIKGAVDPIKEVASATKAAAAADLAKTHADRALAEEIQRLHDKRNVTKNDLMHLKDLQDADVLATQKQKDAKADLTLAQKQLNDKGDLYSQQLDQVESKVKDGRKSQSDLKQSSQELNATWQKMSEDNGPALEGAIAGVLGKTNDLLNTMRSSDWAGFSETLVGLAGGWHQLTIDIDGATKSFENWLIKNGITTLAGSQAGAGGKFGPVPTAHLRQRGFMLGSN
jgi:hypothetical protein